MLNNNYYYYQIQLQNNMLLLQQVSIVNHSMHGFTIIIIMFYHIGLVAVTVVIAIGFLGVLLILSFCLVKKHKSKVPQFDGGIPIHHK